MESLLTKKCANSGAAVGDQWSSSFAAQCTSSLHAEARRFAMADLRVSSDDACDLVQRALCDTLSGARTWEPSERSLLDHVRATIWSRFHCDRETAARHRHVTFETHAIAAEVETTLAARVADAAEDLRLEEAWNDLRDACSNDLAVLSILDAVEDGARTRSDVIEMTGMSLATYRNANLRLARIKDRRQDRSLTRCA